MKRMAAFLIFATGLVICTMADSKTGIGETTGIPLYQRAKVWRASDYVEDLR